MKALTGTPKQVTWAESIRANALEQITAFVCAAKDQARSAGQSEAEIEAGISQHITPVVEKVLAHEQASWWIERRGNISGQSWLRG